MALQAGRGRGDYGTTRQRDDGKKENTCKLYEEFTRNDIFLCNIPFMTTDILKNTRLRTALIEAGLEPLANYCEKNAGETGLKKGFSSFFGCYMGFSPHPSEAQNPEIPVASHS